MLPKGKTVLEQLFCLIKQTKFNHKMDFDIHNVKQNEKMSFFSQFFMYIYICIKDIIWFLYQNCANVPFVVKMNDAVFKNNKFTKNCSSL